MVRIFPFFFHETNKKIEAKKKEEKNLPENKRTKETVIQNTKEKKIRFYILFFCCPRLADE